MGNAHKASRASKGAGADGEEVGEEGGASQRGEAGPKAAASVAPSMQALTARDLQFVLTFTRACSAWEGLPLGDSGLGRGLAGA